MWTQQAREAAAAARRANAQGRAAYRVKVGTAKQRAGAASRGAHSQVIHGLPSVLLGLAAGAAGTLAKDMLMRRGRR